MFDTLSSGKHTWEWCVRKTEVLACGLTLLQLLDTMLPDVLACMVKVYMSCVVSTPQTPVLDSSDQL